MTEQCMNQQASKEPPHMLALMAVRFFALPPSCSHLHMAPGNRPPPSEQGHASLPLTNHAAPFK